MTNNQEKLLQDLIAVRKGIITKCDEVAEKEKSLAESQKDLMELAGRQQDIVEQLTGITPKKQSKIFAPAPKKLIV